MGLAEVQYCAMGVRCTQARFLGGNPNKLRKTSESTLCDRCIQEGYKPEDTLGLASDVTPDKDSSAGQHQVCQFCGKPAVAGFTKREPLVPGDSEIDYDPGAGYYCEKHWEQLHEEGLIVGISSVDEPSQPPEEAFGEVFKAAKVMFDENITEEDFIIPTLAFANHASALPELRTIGERFNEIAPGRRIQEQFAQAFQKKFRGLSPVRISDNVLILESLWLCSDVSRYRDTTILKEIKIDVFMRSVKPEEVERRYEQALAQEGASHNESREGSCGYRSSDTYLSIVVSPGKELDSSQLARFSCRGHQPTFPPPELVRKFYASLKGSVYSGRVRGFIHILGGRQSGVAALPDNLIPACVAWYLRKRGGIADDHRLATLLNRELLSKCKKPEVGVKSGEAIWKSIDKVGNSIERAEFTLQRGLESTETVF